MKHEPKHRVSAQEMSETIDNWIVGRNAERNRKILKRRLCDGIYYEPLAEEFNLSVTQVKNIVYANSDIVFKKLGW